MREKAHDRGKLILVVFSYFAGGSLKIPPASIIFFGVCENKAIFAGEFLKKSV